MPGNRKLQAGSEINRKPAINKPINAFIVKPTFLLSPRRTCLLADIAAPATHTSKVNRPKHQYERHCWFHLVDSLKWQTGRYGTVFACALPTNGMRVAARLTSGLQRENLQWLARVPVRD